MGAICAVKKASFDGVDCVGEDAAATGTVKCCMPFARPIPFAYYPSNETVTRDNEYFSTLEGM